jgi:glycerophosphoryl diester phosphodiesterase
VRRTKIIGHRGAASLAPENTIAAIKAGITAGVDAVEIDIRLTSDKHFVLSHDNNMQRLWGLESKISDLDLKILLSLTAAAGRPIITLTDALKASGDTPIFIEAKGVGWARLLAEYLSSHPKKAQCTVIAYHHHELYIFGQNAPKIPIYAIGRLNSFDALNNARIFGFDGIDVNFWGLNPLVYWLSRRRKLSVVVYTMNLPWLAQIFQLLYPNLAITTNVPQKMQFLRPRHLRTKHPRHLHLHRTPSR